MKLPIMKPCCLCGHREPELVPIVYPKIRWWVECIYCGKHGPIKRTKRGAIRGWNRMKNDPIISQRDKTCR